MLAICGSGLTLYPDKTPPSVFITFNVSFQHEILLPLSYHKRGQPLQDTMISFILLFTRRREFPGTCLLFYLSPGWLKESQFRYGYFQYWISVILSEGLWESFSTLHASKDPEKPWQQYLASVAVLFYELGKMDQGEGGGVTQTTKRYCCKYKPGTSVPYMT